MGDTNNEHGRVSSVMYRRVVAGLGAVLALAALLALAGVAAAHLGDVSPIIGTVAVGATPLGVAVDTRTGHAFVVNNGDNSVSVIDTEHAALLRTVTVGTGPTAVVMDERDRQVLVSNADTSASQQTGQFLVLRPLWSGLRSLSVLEPASGSLRRTVRADVALAGAAIDARHGRIYVATTDNALPGLSGDGTVGVLRAGRGGLARLAGVAGIPLGLAVDNRANRLVVATDDRGGAVSVLDATSGRLLRQTAIGVVLPGETVAVDERRGRAFVITSSLAGNSGTVCSFDTRSGALLRTTALDSAAAAVAVDEATGHVFVTTIGPATSLTIMPGYRPLYSPLNVPLSTGAGSVAMLDARSGALLRSIRVGIAPGSVGVDTRHHHVLVASVGAMDSTGAPLGPGTVSVLDARSGALLRRMTVGTAPSDIAVDERADRAVVLNLGGIVHAADTWGWLPPWLRQRLPFLPQQASGAHSAPASVTVLDTARL